MKDLSREPQASIPKACGHWARTKGAYRFFGHEQVRAEKILQAHRDAMLERASQEKTILLVQDTTSLHYGLAAEEFLKPKAE